MINYSVSLRKNPVKGTTQVHGQAQVTEVLNLEEFAAFVASHNSKYEEEDVMAVLVAIVKRMRELFLDGKKVRLGSFGDFYLTLRTKAAKKVEEFTTDNILDVKVIFKPGQYLLGIRDEAEFNEVATRQSQAKAHADEMAMMAAKLAALAEGEGT